MTRLAPPDPDALSDRQQEVYDAIRSGPRGQVRGPLAMWLHRPELADRAQKLGQYCRYDTLLPPRLSEIAILTVARIWRSEFEWQAHKRHALDAGVDPLVVEAIRTGAEPPFTAEDERVVHAFSKAAHFDRCR